MCGISGILNHNGIQNSIREMNCIISHRGPDDEGYLLVDKLNNVQNAGGKDTPEMVWKYKSNYSPNKPIEKLNEGVFKLSLGHRRLSIIDLSPAGHQPMSYLNNRYFITYNGEIYNYKELKKELLHFNYEFKSSTDTEVILASFDHWGVNCLDKFIGMWAFAIFDKKTDELFISRDRYGIKPLYYWFSPFGDFCFASEIKQFTVLKGWEAKLNPCRVYDKLMYAIQDHTEETLFKGVYQLKGGFYIKSKLHDYQSASSLNIVKWYKNKIEPFKGAYSEALLRFKTLFENSIEQHLEADVKVGSALSGGLDSSAIVCQVNRILKSKNKDELQNTFSSCSQVERYDERKWMDIVVSNTNVNAHFIYPRLEDVFTLTPKIIWHFDEPYQSLSPFLAYNVFNLAKENNVKVLLNGQGADEYLGGYGQFTTIRYANILKQFKVLLFLKEIIEIKKHRNIDFANLIKGIISNLLSDNLRENISLLQKKNEWNLIDKNKLGIPGYQNKNRLSNDYRSIDKIRYHMLFDDPLAKYLHWEDRNSMANSVEARVPFLDHRLVEFCCSLPESFLERGGITKTVLRDALNDTLPFKIRDRKDKMGFTTPEEYWIKTQPDIFREKIKDAIEISNGIIKCEAIEYFNQVIRGKIFFDYTYWRLIIFGEWLTKFNIKIS